MDIEDDVYELEPLEDDFGADEPELSAPYESERSEASASESEIYVIGDKQRLVVRSFMDSMAAVGINAQIFAPDLSFINMLPLAKIHVILCLDSHIGMDVMDLLVDRVWRYGMHLYVIGKLEEFGMELQLKTKQLPMTVFPSWPISMERLQRAIYRNSQVRKRILVVDDDPMMLRCVRDWLGESYEVSLVSNSFEAIDYLREHETDLVLLDLEMPGMSGLDLLYQIRHDAKLYAQAIIILTAKADRSFVISAMELHPNGYILKSSSPDEIRQGVNNYFARL
ncbi:MAG: response regulator transcription factor [Treponema sp.]|nr:response regulator transcription factor [Treponema sp.]